MAFNSRSGTTKDQRERFLKDHGFEMDRHASGSHSVWVNAELRDLMQQRKIDMPPNIGTTDQKVAWQITLCKDPGFGTWRTVRRQAEWCANKIAELKAPPVEKGAKNYLSRQFAKAADKNWRKEIKGMIKMGFSRDVFPAMPSALQLASPVAKPTNFKGGL